MAGADRPRLGVIGDLESAHVSGRSAPFTELGYEVDEIDAASLKPKPMLECVRNLRRRQRDIVHIHYAASVGAWLWVATGGKAPTVVTAMGGDILDDEQIPLPGLARWMTREVLRRADVATAKTQILANRLRQLGVPSDRIVKVFWGVDRKRFSRVDAGGMRRALGLEERHRAILSPRILQRFYNIHVIVDAMPTILEAYPDARLILTEYRADPDYKAELTAQAEELGVSDAIIWAGAASTEEMPALYSLSSVVVGIPPSDGFPQTVLEAMACGTPCVVSDLLCTREILEDDQLALFVAPNAKDVADAVGRLLSDTILSSRLIEKGMQLVEARADLTRELDRVGSIYAGLIDSASNRPRPWPVRVTVCLILLAWSLRNTILGRR